MEKMLKELKGIGFEVKEIDVGYELYLRDEKAFTIKLVRNKTIVDFHSDHSTIETTEVFSATWIIVDNLKNENHNWLDQSSYEFKPYRKFY